MTSKGWQNLALVAVLTFYIIALVAVLTFYIILIAFFIINSNEINICENYAEDYCAFWSAGKLINQHGFAAIYDLDLLSQSQQEVYPQASSASFEPFAIMYLPFFLVPFQLLSLIPLPVSFIFWSLVNLIGFVLYLQLFTKQLTGQSLSIRLILLVMLSMPVVVNLMLGQVNVLLGICVGEFIRAVLNDKPLKAGLWLGSWLLKPQLLIVIIPFLLLQRSKKVLSGFSLTTIGVLGISYGLVQMKGFRNLIEILFNASGGGVASSPQVMMNWRMLGWHITSVTSQTLGWIVIGLGSLATLGITFFAFRKKLMADKNKIMITILGILTATSTATWHAHLPMSIILIPPLIYLSIKNPKIKKLFSLWIYLPILVTFILYILIPFTNFSEQLIQLIDGSRGFILNLLILAWAVSHHLNSKNRIKLNHEK